VPTPTTAIKNQETPQPEVRMCNPRKVAIRTVERLSEAWTAELVGTATATADASAQARLTLPYGENLPSAFRAIFERRLASDPAWRYHEGVFRAELDHGHITYSPQTLELELFVELTEQVTAAGQATLQLSGEQRHTVDQEFVGEARTDSGARHLAERARDAALEGERDRLRHEARRARIRAGEDQANVTRAERMAQEDAARQLEIALGDRVSDLTAQARAELEIQRNEVLRLVNRVYAGALQEVMEAYARRQGAANIQSTERDGIIEISFELERAGSA
jgi:FtsH ternary system-associated peptide